MKRTAAILALVFAACDTNAPPQDENHPVAKLRVASSTGALTPDGSTELPGRRAYGEVFVEDFGAIGYNPPAASTASWANPKGMVDSGPSIQAALDAIPEDGVLRFGKCRYWIGQTLTVKKPMTIEVSGSIDRITNCGFAVKYGIVALDLAKSTTVRGLFLRSDGRPPNKDGTPGVIDPKAHGIFMHATSHLAGVMVYGFEGDGIHIEAGVPASNANEWKIDGGASLANKGWGLFVRGSDSNAGVANRFSAVGNKIGNIRDNSFLGNTYVATHTDGSHIAYESGWDTQDGKRVENRNNHNLFLNCYEEDGSIADLSGGTIWIGGFGASMMAPGVPNPGAVLRNDGSGFSAHHFTAVSKGSVVARLGGLPWDGSTIGEWWLPKTKSPLYIFPSTLRPGKVDFASVPAGSMIGLSVSTASSADGANLVEAPGGARLGAAKVVALGAAPTTGTWRRGDLVLSTVPAAGQPWAWQCVTAGTPGTWRALNAP